MTEVWKNDCDFRKKPNEKIILLGSPVDCCPFHDCTGAVYVPVSYTHLEVAYRPSGRVEKGGANKRDLLDEHQHPAPDLSLTVPGDNDGMIPIVLDLGPKNRLGKASLGMLLCKFFVFFIF